MADALRLEDFTEGARVRLKVDIVPRTAGSVGTVIYTYLGGGGFAYPISVRYDEGGFGNHQAHELELLTNEEEQ